MSYDDCTNYLARLGKYWNCIFSDGRVPRSVVGLSLSLHTYCTVHITYILHTTYLSQVVETGVGSVGEGKKKVCGTCFIDSLVLAFRHCAPP